MGVSFDMLSLLPDSLLSTIVSSLPFKEAVRTSILSKNWMSVYKSTTNIEFNDLFFVKYDKPKEIIDAQRKAFSDFTETWIENFEGNVIDKFTLLLTTTDIFYQLIDRCLLFATRNQVKKLELDFTSTTSAKDAYYCGIIDEATIELPNHVYGYTGLEYIKLYSCNFEASKMVNFHSLKEISLGFMRIRLITIKALLTNCKKLESLSFYRCWNSDDYFSLKEEYLGLKKLVINKCHFDFDNFRVNAPNLKVFKYNGLMLFSITEMNSHALDEVDLDFSPEYGWEEHGEFLYKFLKEFSSARILTVCSYLLQVIYTGGQEKPMYCMKVKHLIMKTAIHEFEFMGIAFMLKSCPMLERLTIEICDEKLLLGYEPLFDIDLERFWIDSVEVYKCMESSLREIDIKNFKANYNEIFVIGFLLMNGRSLRKMNINILKDDVEGDENEEEIVNFRRQEAELFFMYPNASTNLEITIY